MIFIFCTPYLMAHQYEHLSSLLQQFHTLPDVNIAQDISESLV